jgi:predicted RNA binding protein YcfA (HicA-like mRNA interferase family)
LNAVSGKKLGQILERNGFVLKSQASSHRKYVKAGYPPIIVPIHGSTDLKTGLLATLLKLSGLTESDLL